MYGRRHLLQVVAVKRLQGEGWSLAEIQERLIGAGDAVLEEIAALPEFASESVSDSEPAVKSGRSQDAAASSEDDAAPVARRARFWAVPPADPGESAPVAGMTAPVTAPMTLSRPTASVVEPTLAQAIRLASDVTLVLGTGRAPDTADLTALAEAARPLLELLRHLGLSES